MQALPKIQNMNSTIVKNCIEFNRKPVNIDTRHVNDFELTGFISQLTTYRGATVPGHSLFIDGDQHATYIEYGAQSGTSYGSDEYLLKTQQLALQATRVRIIEHTVDANREYIFCRSGKKWYLQVNDRNQMIEPNDYKIAQLLGIDVETVRELKV